MNIIGNGVDIVDNTRIKNAIKNKFFVRRIFTVNEIKKSKNLNSSTSFRFGFVSIVGSVSRTD